MSLPAPSAPGRLLALFAGATGLAVLMAMPHAQAAWRATPVPGPASPAEAAAAQALGLLTVAARAARTRTYRGVQYVTSWRAGAETQHVYEVSHSPATGLVVSDPSAVEAGFGLPDMALTADSSDSLDDRLLGLMAEHYQLAIGPPAAYAGRAAVVVEARRAGTGAPAGRFWIDQASGLLLHREVFDEHGTLLRSSGFTSLTVRPLPPVAATPPAVPPATTAPATTPALRLVAAGERLDQPSLAALRAEGWPVPTSLPDDLDLFDARLLTTRGASVLHLAYSDGLSTMSLFVQPGRLGGVAMSGFTAHQWGGTQVFVAPGTPMRVVWPGAGRVWTLVSELPADSVTPVVEALPHDRAPHQGLLSRLWHGVARLASWLNPFG